jgi:CheY-like chemotaxis protein
MDANQLTLLLIEDDPENLHLLQTVLTDEWYQTIPANSLAQAMTLLDTTSYHLVLSDLFGHTPEERLANANLVYRQAFPTPVGIITARTLLKEAPDLQTFAFTIQKPYNIDTLLMSIAATINPQIAETHLPEVAIVRRLFAALNAQDVDSLMALCTEDIVYASQRAEMIQSKAAYRLFAEHEFHHFPRAHFELLGIYATPTGLAARYHVTWKSTTAGEASVSSGIVFRFQDGLIAQIGNRFQHPTA